MSISKQFDGGSPADPDRMRPYDCRDKYRWPDPDDGWSGPLAGYPPKHPAREGRPCPPGVVYPDDPPFDPVTGRPLPVKLAANRPANTAPPAANKGSSANAPEAGAGQDRKAYMRDLMRRKRAAAKEKEQQVE